MRVRATSKASGKKSCSSRTEAMNPNSTEEEKGEEESTRVMASTDHGEEIAEEEEEVDEEEEEVDEEEMRSFFRAIATRTRK